MAYEKGGVIREHKWVSETLEYGPAFLVGVGCSMLLRESGALLYPLLINVIIFLTVVLLPPMVSLHQRVWAGLTGQVFLGKHGKPYRNEITVLTMAADALAALAFAFFTALLVGHVFDQHALFGHMITPFALVLIGLAHIGSRPRSTITPEE